jgi:hypothetical protein
MISYSLVGTVGWVVLGLIIWVVLNDRFQNDFNRADVLVPDSPGPPASKRPAAGDGEDWPPAK